MPLKPTNSFRGTLRFVRGVLLAEKALFLGTTVAKVPDSKMFELRSRVVAVLVWLLTWRPWPLGLLACVIAIMLMAVLFVLLLPVVAVIDVLRPGNVSRVARPRSGVAI